MENEIRFNMNDGKCCIFTHNSKIKKNDVVVAPSDCEVYLIEDNDLTVRLPNGPIKDKSLIGKKGNFVCISKKHIKLRWGIGDILVTVGDKNETDKIYGTYQLEINNSKNFVKTFKTSHDYVLEEDVRAETLPMIKEIAENVILEVADNPKCSSGSELLKLRKKIGKRISAELIKRLKEDGLGLNLVDFKVEKYWFKENNTMVDKNKQEMSEQSFKDFAESIKKDITDSVKISVQNLIDSFNEERKQANLELYESAKEDAIRNLKITTDLLIDKANDNDNDGLAAAAGCMYSHIEETIRNSHKLKDYHKKFWIQEASFNEILKDFPDNTYVKTSAFKKDIEIIDGKTYVQVPPLLRFYILGLNYKEAELAARYWTDINKMRHRSQENEKTLEALLNKKGITKKEYLKKILRFFREKKIYTRD